MSMDGWDAWQEEGLDSLYNELGPQYVRDHGYELYREHYQEAVKEFRIERLRSYYAAHADLAMSAFEELRYARTLLPDHPKAALVFARTAIELGIKNTLLKPLVYGLVHMEVLAEPIATVTTKDSGFFGAVLTGILREFGGVDFDTFKRTGGLKILREEMTEAKKARDRVVHGGGTVDVPVAELAVTVADTILNEILPQVLKKFDLHLHPPGTVCINRHTSNWQVMIRIGEFISVRSFPCVVELDEERLLLEFAPDRLTGRLILPVDDSDLAKMRSQVSLMMLEHEGEPVRYKIELSPDSSEFVASKSFQ